MSCEPWALEPPWLQVLDSRAGGMEEERAELQQAAAALERRKREWAREEEAAQEGAAAAGQRAEAARAAEERAAARLREVEAGRVRGFPRGFIDKTAQRVVVWDLLMSY